MLFWHSLIHLSIFGKIPSKIHITGACQYINKLVMLKVMQWFTETFQPLWATRKTGAFIYLLKLIQSQQGTVSFRETSDIYLWGRSVNGLNHPISELGGLYIVGQLSFLKKKTQQYNLNITGLRWTCGKGWY